MKKIIVILTGILLVLLMIFLIVNYFRNNDTGVDMAEIAEPTGIVVPTQSIVAGELDIVGIDPKDDAQNIPLDQTLRIEFSRSFTDQEIEFFINPNTAHNTKIEGNKLIITPQNQWEPGMHYNYSVNFTDDNQKVRLYRFTTTGPTQEFLPDTQPEGLYEETQNEHKTKRPDIYVANNTPYESGTFSVSSDFEPNPPAHYYLIVKRKISDEEQVRQDVNLWLQQLDLSQEQIDGLDIRYE